MIKVLPAPPVLVVIPDGVNDDNGEISDVVTVLMTVLVVVGGVTVTVVLPTPLFDPGVARVWVTVTVGGLTVAQLERKLLVMISVPE